VTTIVTVSGDSTFSHVTTTSALVAVTSGASSSTKAPSLDNGGGSSGSSSGLSSKEKGTIIGVVVGIGGAILLGGLAIVAWRIWGRKRGDADDDDLMGSANPSHKEKTNSFHGGSTGIPLNPFKKTLDQYHNPGPVNTASNF
jgi:hypothetical protein